MHSAGALAWDIPEGWKAASHRVRNPRVGSSSAGMSHFTRPPGQPVAQDEEEHSGLGLLVEPGRRIRRTRPATTLDSLHATGDGAARSRSVSALRWGTSPKRLHPSLAIEEEKPFPVRPQLRSHNSPSGFQCPSAPLQEAPAKRNEKNTNETGLQKGWPTPDQSSHVPTFTRAIPPVFPNTRISFRNLAFPVSSSYHTKPRTQSSKKILRG